MAFTRYHLGEEIPLTSNADGIMDALETLFAVAADVDTSAAVSGVLTWTRDTTAGSQAIYSNAFGPADFRIIIAIHDSGSPASGPNMSVDTYAAARILVGLCRSASGAYVNWYDAAPFSGCSFDGYYLLSDMTGVASLRAMLSSKDLILQVVNTAGVQTAHLGAIIKGVTSFQESDGYRYGQMSSGPGDMSSTWRSSGNSTAGHMPKHGTSSGHAHCGIYEVGSSTWTPVQAMTIMTVASTVDSAKFGASTAALIPIPICQQTAPLYTVGSWNAVVESALGLTAQNVGTTHVRFGSSVIAVDEQAVLFARSVA